MSDIENTVEAGIKATQNIGDQLMRKDQESKANLPNNAIKEAKEALKSVSNSMSDVKESESERAPTPPLRSSAAKMSSPSMHGD